MIARLAQMFQLTLKICTTFPGDNSDTVPPESIPNSEVKRVSGDGSVGFPHVRVAHRQVPITRRRPSLAGWPFFRIIELATRLRIRNLTHQKDLASAFCERFE